MNRMITLCVFFVTTVLMPQIAWAQQGNLKNDLKIDRDAYLVVDMVPGDTVGAVSAKITRNAGNWASGKVLVVNSNTDAIYPKNQYRRLPGKDQKYPSRAYAQILFPKDMVKTAPTILNSESIEKLCAEKIDLASIYPISSGKTRGGQCVYSLSKINSIPDGNAALTAPIYIPLDWKPKIVPPTPVDACRNIEGLQLTVPEGLIKDENGNCVRSPADPSWRTQDLLIIIGLLAFIVGGAVLWRMRNRAHHEDESWRRRPPA